MSLQRNNNIKMMCVVSPSPLSTTQICQQKYSS